MSTQSDKDKLRKKTEARTIILGGKHYVLSPLNLNVLADIEEEFNCSLEQVHKMLRGKGSAAVKRCTLLRTLIYILLKENYPEMTKTKVGALVDLTNMDKVDDAAGKALTGE